MINKRNEETHKQDTSSKLYWKRKDEFADLFNSYMYAGKPMIHAEELIDQDTDSTGTVLEGGFSTAIKGVRDNILCAKIYRGTRYLLLAIENQEEIHYAMPLRVMGYDYVTYDKQYKEQKAELKRRGGKLSGAEFLSGIRKEDRLIPVVTLVLYWGEQKWDGPRCLYDMLDIPDELKAYVSDYKINVIDMKNSNLPLHNQNNKDLFQLLAIIYDNEKSWAERRQLVREYEESHLISNEVKETIVSTTNIKLSCSEREVNNVCTLWEEVFEDGRQAAITEIIEIMLKKGKTPEEISSLCDLDIEMVSKVAENLLTTA